MYATSASSRCVLRPSLSNWWINPRCIQRVSVEVLSLYLRPASLMLMEPPGSSAFSLYSGSASLGNCSFTLCRLIPIVPSVITAANSLPSSVSLKMESKFMPSCLAAYLGVIKSLSWFRLSFKFFSKFPLLRVNHTDKLVERLGIQQVVGHLNDLTHVCFGKISNPQYRCLFFASSVRLCVERLFIT